MKELKHDIESYVITIKRKGQQTTAVQTIVSAPQPLPTKPAQPTRPAPQSTKAAEITAPLPGIIIAIKVQAGDTIREGQELAVLEAMKMENSIESPRPGTIRSINVSTGDTVSEGTIIMTIE